MFEQTEQATALALRVWHEAYLRFKKRDLDEINADRAKANQARSKALRRRAMRMKGVTWADV